MMKIISYQIYPFDLMIARDVSYKKLKKELKKRLPEEIHSEIKQFKGNYDAQTVMFSSGQTVIRFIKFTPRNIAHEVFHAISFLMNRLGMKLTDENSEAYAYLIGYITNEIYKL